MRLMKVCARCGVEFAKPAKWSQRQWSERRFCSRRCAARAMWDDRRARGLAQPYSAMPLCACGCGRHVRSHACRYIGAHKPVWRDVTRDGYVRVYAPRHPLASKDGLLLEDRKSAHDAGLDVPDGYHVHHVNGDKLDNRIENLEVIPAGEHHRRHIRERGYVENQYGIWPLRC